MPAIARRFRRLSLTPSERLITWHGKWRFFTEGRHLQVMQRDAARAG
jgi:hypothetical protein